MSDRPFLIYIHIFRGLAIFLIVLRHLMYLLGANHPHFHDFLMLICGNSSMFFVYISGFLFKHLMGNFNYSNFMRKKILYILIPYVIVSTPALFLYAIGSQYGEYILESEFIGFAEKPLVLRLFLVIIYGAQQYHFWFIPMIFIIFLSSPLLVRLDRNPKYYWLLPVLVILSFFIGRQGYAPIRSFLYFMPVFILGMFSCRHKEALFNWVFGGKFRLWLLLTGVVILSWMYLEFRHFEILFIQKLLLSVLLTVILTEVRSRSIISGLSVISDYSFLIYLIHIYVLMFTMTVFRNLGIEFQSGISKLIVFFVFNITIDISAIYLAKRVLGKHSRLVIGI